MGQKEQSGTVPPEYPICLSDEDREVYAQIYRDMPLLLMSIRSYPVDEGIIRAQEVTSMIKEGFYDAVDYPIYRGSYLRSEEGRILQNAAYTEFDALKYIAQAEKSEDNRIRQVVSALDEESIYWEEFDYSCINALDISEKPKGLEFVKMFSPKLILDALQQESKQEDLLAKLTNHPVVVSPFMTDPDTGIGPYTYRSVGVTYSPDEIVVAFPTDINSTQTLKGQGPSIDEAIGQPVLTSWDALMRCMDPTISTRLNEVSAYPEVWIKAGRLTSIVVRSYDAMVSHQDYIVSVDERLEDRALAACVLSDMLGGLPIEVIS